jgi:hypothetical protein
MNGDQELMLWEAHRTACARCQEVDASKTKTLALACIQGARLVKDLVAAARKLQRENELVR